jgi:hypothetical protein
MSTIVCPNCGKEISEAFRLKIEKEILKKEQERHKLELTQLETELKQKLANENKLILKDQENEKKELKEQLDTLNKFVTELKSKDKQRESQMMKKIAQEEEKIKESISKDYRLKELELEKKLSDTKKALDDAQRKATQGSQQLQGEVLELDLEEKLKATFPGDEFSAIPKGVEGGDIWQKVILRGKTVGSILWETKRTKTWSNAWTSKLKTDAGKLSASETILISQALPSDVKNFDRKEGVWITTYEHAINICRFVRFLISSVASVKSSASQTEEEWEKVRDYMMSDSFKHKMQSHFDGISSLKASLDADKRATMLRWKKQESIIDNMDSNTTNFYGELKAIVSRLPQISGVDALSNAT